MRRMFPFTGALLALCLISAAPRAAGAETALGTSAWSLEIGTDFGAGATDASFAIRRHSSASTAFRFAVEVDLDESDGNGTRTDTGFPDIDTEQFVNFAATNFSIQWMHFAPIRDNVTATFAVGPVVETERGSIRVNTGLNGGENRATFTSYGIDIGLGMEWFFNRRVSLGGQTGLRATTGSGTQINIDRSAASRTETIVESDETDIEIGTARLHLTAYF